MSDLRHGDIEMRARVLRYRANAMMDDRAGGGHRSFDATTLEVLAPSRLNGNTLTIYHDRPMGEASPWRMAGAVLRFMIDEDLLKDSTQVFTAAARDLRVEEARCA
jgi:hypothetical protein